MHAVHATLDFVVDSRETYGIILMNMTQQIT